MATSTTFYQKQKKYLLSRGIFKQFFSGLFSLYSNIILKYYAKLTINGEENLPKSPFILCSNHSSHIDSAILMTISKHSFNKIGMLSAVDYWFENGWFSRVCRFFLYLIPIDRRSKDKKILTFSDTISLCHAFLTHGEVLILYPEGKRSKTGTLQPFKQGAAMMASKLGLPLVPCFIEGSFDAMSKGAIFIKPSSLKVTIGRPIESTIDESESFETMTKNLESEIRRLGGSNTNFDQHDHFWGYKDTQFIYHPENRSIELTGNRYSICGYRMYSFIPLIEKLLSTKLEFSLKKEQKCYHLPPSKLRATFCDELKQILIEGTLTLENKDRVIHSHGQVTSVELYIVQNHTLERVVDGVVYVKTEDEVSALVKLASIHNICLVPYGGGTNVSCSLKLPNNETRPILSVDMKGLDKIEWVDKQNMRASIQAGITGMTLEKQLYEQGLMMGHEPDSLEFSTLGGWIATNASGMKKNRYGNIEDIVENVTLETPKGTVSKLSSFSRTSMGIDPEKMVIGHEGNLGIITKATVKLYPLPETKYYQSLIFRSFEEGIEFLKALRDSENMPASIRLVDNPQFLLGQTLKPKAKGLKLYIKQLQKLVLSRKGFDLDKIAACTLVFEGKKNIVKQQLRTIKTLSKQHRSILGGSENGKQGYNLTYAIAYIRDFLSQFDVLGETFETTAPWHKIHDICNAVTHHIHEQHKHYELPGTPLISYRVTQLYHTGVCIYFTYGIFVKGIKDPHLVLHAVDESCRQIIMDNGGSISHHHGVGKLRQKFLPQVASKYTFSVLNSVKKSLDPKNIFCIGNASFLKSD